jgi:hypothetical protein
MLTPTSQMDEAVNQLQLQQIERTNFSWVCFPKLEQEEACTYSHGNCPLIHVVVFWVTKSNCSQWLLAILNAEFESMLVRWVSVYGLLSTFLFFVLLLQKHPDNQWNSFKEKRWYVIETMQAS